MAITRTAKGTQTANDDASGLGVVSLSGVAIAAAASVVVVVACSDGAVPDTVTWNALALTKRVEATRAEVAVSIWSRDNVAGATGAVDVDLSGTAPGSCAFAVLEVAGADTTGSTDKTAGATGSSTSPSSGSTATTAQANELLVGGVATAGPPADTAGTWGGSFTDGQRAGVDGSATDATVSEGFRSVTATGTYSAAKTGITSRPWAAAILTMEEAAPQSSTPAAVDMTATVNAPTVTPGPVVSTPASVAMTASESGAAGVAGLRVITPASVAMTASVSPDPADSPFAKTADRSPAQVVSQNPVTLRATAPAELGDGNTATDTREVLVGVSSGTARLVATAMADAVDPGSTITHVKVFAYVGLLPGAIFDHYTAARLVWKLGATQATGAVAVPPFVDLEAPWIGGAGKYVSLHLRSSADLTTKPGGGAWTWADVNALVDVGVEVDYSLTGGEVGGVLLGEVWVEVYGPEGSEPEILELPKGVGRIGNIVRKATINGAL